jgi:hypothetical protein
MSTTDERDAGAAASARRGLGGILLANGLTLLVALLAQWPLAVLLWPFWIQSLIIGWFSRKRMLALRQFSTAGFTSNGRPVPETEAGKRSTAAFFSLHYGGFHAGYLVFLLVLQANHRLSPWDWLGIAIATAGFWWGHRQSHRRNLEADLGGRRNLGALMFLPYARVLPMHLAIGLGAGMGDSDWIGLLVFSALKTAADALMHVVEHRWLQAPARDAAQGS